MRNIIIVPAMMVLFVACEPSSAAAEPELSVLHAAARRGDVSRIESLLQAVPTLDIDQWDADGAAPLHLAAETGSVDVLRALLRRGAAVDRRQRGPAGRTALMLAARAGHEGSVQALIDAGADVAARESGGERASALDLVLQRCDAGRAAADAARALLRAGAEVTPRAREVCDAGGVIDEVEAELHARAVAHGHIEDIDGGASSLSHQPAPKSSIVQQSKAEGKAEPAEDLAELISTKCSVLRGSPKLERVLAVLEHDWGVTTAASLREAAGEADDEDRAHIIEQLQSRSTGVGGPGADSALSPFQAKKVHGLLQEMASTATRRGRREEL